MSQVNEWKLGGEVFLWCYPGSKNYSGWHLTATDEGASSLALLMDAFQAENEYRHRKVKLSAASEPILAIPNSGTKAISATALVLDFNVSADNSGQWKLEVTGSDVRLRFGRSKLGELRDAFQGIPRGEGDYCLGLEDEGDNSDQNLWIWWYPSTRLKGGV